jgi:hypothetical protein
MIEFHELPPGQGKFDRETSLLRMAVYGRDICMGTLKDCFAALRASTSDADIRATPWRVIRADGTVGPERHFPAAKSDKPDKVAEALAAEQQPVTGVGGNGQA